MNKKFEIRKNGVTICQSSIPGCGYPPKLLRQIQSDGYGYYAAGKRMKKAGETDAKG